MMCIDCGNNIQNLVDYLGVTRKEIMEYLRDSCRWDHYIEAFDRREDKKVYN